LEKLIVEAFASRGMKVEFVDPAPNTAKLAAFETLRLVSNNDKIAYSEKIEVAVITSGNAADVARNVARYMPAPLAYQGWIPVFGDVRLGGSDKPADYFSGGQDPSRSVVVIGSDASNGINPQRMLPPAVDKRRTSIEKDLPSTDRIAASMRQNYPDASVSVVQVQKPTRGPVVKTVFESKGAQRTILTGNYNDLVSIDPSLKSQVAAMMTGKSILYQGKSEGYVDAVFRGSDLTSIVLDANGKLIGASNLTVQDAVYGTREKSATGAVEVRDAHIKPVYYLAQVVGEKGGGATALNNLLDVAASQKMDVVASAFPGHMGEKGIYGPKSKHPADFWALNRRVGDYPVFDPSKPVSLDNLPTYFVRGQTPWDVNALEPYFAAQPGGGFPTNVDQVRNADRFTYGWNFSGKNQIPLHVQNDTSSTPAEVREFGGALTPNTTRSFPEMPDSSPGVPRTFSPEETQIIDAKLPEWPINSRQVGLAPGNQALTNGGLVNPAQTPSSSSYEQKIKTALYEKFQRGEPITMYIADSGYGGQLFANEVHKHFENAGVNVRLVVQGDHKLAPYGNNSDEVLRAKVYNQISNAYKAGANVFVWGCNTASVATKPLIKEIDGKQYIVPPPGVQGPNIPLDQMKVMILVDDTSRFIAESGARDGYVPAAVLGTNGTIRSGEYGKQVQALTGGRQSLQEVAAPEWADIVESGKNLATDPATV
jgi:glutamate racemase